ncbi:MAG: hypothetical protein ACERKN_12685 [Velocimicrobium sp.]
MKYIAYHCTSTKDQNTGTNFNRPTYQILRNQINDIKNFHSGLGNVNTASKVEAD